MEGSSLCHALTTSFILLQLAIYMDSCLATRPIPTKTNTEYIKKSCGITMYPQLCYKSLSTYANKIQTSPKLLASTALSVTLSATRSSSAMMKKLSKSQGLKPREASAMLDCVEELSDSVDELQRSIVEMGSIIGGSNFEVQMNDILTWVSAALTDDDTCMDGFAGNAMNGNVKTIVRTHILKVAHLTSNALALIKNYAGAQTTPLLK
uniref:Pectinesterase inhibitor domain-containing protein n=1 Tax=Davidia involucrata TaxID=16924 RepID=A0A5B7AIK4_DAVIN